MRFFVNPLKQLYIHKFEVIHMYKHANIPLKESSSFGITPADEEDVPVKQLYIHKSEVIHMYKHAHIPLKEGSSFCITPADEEGVPSVASKVSSPSLSMSLIQ